MNTSEIDGPVRFRNSSSVPSTRSSRRIVRIPMATSHFSVIRFVLSASAISRNNTRMIGRMHTVSGAAIAMLRLHPAMPVRSRQGWRLCLPGGGPCGGRWRRTTTTGSAVCRARCASGESKSVWRRCGRRRAMCCGNDRNADRNARSLRRLPREGRPKDRWLREVIKVF